MPILRFFLVAAIAFAADAPLPELRTVPKTAGSIFHVRNPGTQPLTAFLIELVDYPGSSYTLWQDDPNDVVAPGATKEIQVTNMTVGAVPDYVKLVAAIYQDGSTAGVPDRVELLIGRRKTAVETAREAMKKIEAAGTPEAAKKALVDWSEAMPPVSRANRTTAIGVNQSMAKSLIAEAVKRLDTEGKDKTLTWLVAQASRPAH